MTTDLVRADHPIVAEDCRAILEAPLPWTDLAGKRVLVTGATGMIGGYIAATLAHLRDRLAAPPEVHLLVRDRHKAEARFGGMPGVFIHAEGLARAVAQGLQPDHIFHAASPASPKHYASAPVDVIAANVRMTWELLERFAEQASPRFLFVSSPDVYGLIPDGVEAIGEEDFHSCPTLSVRNCYAESKRLAENLLASWSYQHGLDFRIVRPFHTFGPGLRLDDGRVFADFLRAALRGEDIVMTSDGSALRTFCYVADTVSAIFLVALAGASGTGYNIGAPANEMSILEFARAVVALVPEKRLRVQHTAVDLARYMPSPVRRGNPDISRISALGWAPRSDVATALHRTYAALLCE